MRIDIGIVFCIPLISACNFPPEVPIWPSGFRIFCGFADVIVREADVVKVEKAFAGDDSLGQIICREVLAASQEGQPGSVPVSNGIETALPLPTGERVNLKILPPTSLKPVR